MAKQPSAFALPVAPLLEKMGSLDPDYRVMALMDIQKELIRSTTSQSSRSPTRPLDQTYMDEATETKLTEAVLKLLVDSNAEVKNAAVPCLALLTRKARKQAMQFITTELMNAIGLDDGEKRDVACLALKSVVNEIPRDGPTTSATVDNLVTRILEVLQNADEHPQNSFELLAILTDIFTRFSDIISTLRKTLHDALSQLSSLLSTARPNIRKRATVTIAALISSSDDSLFDSLTDDLLQGLQSSDSETSGAWVGVLGALARTSAKLVGVVLRQALPGVMAQLEDVENADAVEGALVTLEMLVLRCPSETSDYLSNIVTRALELVKYDPNFVQLDEDEDDPMGSDDEQEEDDDFEDAYSDDEDVSWKIRRSSAKLLLVLIATRNELLTDFYKSASPVLISRFDEREESVRIEVLEAYAALLTQTAAVTGAAETLSRNKRKRSEEMEEPEDETPLGQLQSQLPALLKVLLKLLSVKSLATRQQAFSLLRQNTIVLNGGLEAHAAPICSAVASALHSSDHASAGGGATTASLTVSVLSFLSAFFERHPSRVYASYLNDLAPRIVQAMLDKLQRVSAEGFTAASALVRAVRPVTLSRGSASPLPSNYLEPVKQIYTATRDVLKGNFADADVRERALETLGDLLVHEGDSLSGAYDECLPLVTARFANEGTQTTAVLVIGRIAESPTAKGEVFDAWLLEALTAVAVSLRKNKRLSKASTIGCLSALLTRLGPTLPENTASDLVLELRPLIDTPSALQVVVLVLSLQPASRSIIEEEILPAVLEQVKSPLIQAPAVDALLAFFSAWVATDHNCASRIVPRLAEQIDTSSRLPDVSQGGTVAYTTAAKCIGAAVASGQNTASVVQAFATSLQKKDATEAQTYFALLALGEIGRTVDMSSNIKVYERVLELFAAKSEEVRSAAAFAAGNMAVGSPSALLQPILQKIFAEKSPSQRLLYLHALKEVILHMSPSQLEAIADSLWTPLFADETDSEDDGERNVKAACVGKLTTANPLKYLPQLQSRLKSSASTRATIAAAIRYTFIDTSSSYDELLAPFVVDFLSLMHDSDLIVRRLSLSSLNAAIQNKPHLVIDHLATLQPQLYAETEIKPELCRKVPMGPWTVTEDDGLENRKTAYETMYTMLSTCFIKIDLPTFLSRVIAALSDVNEIRILGFMLLHRLAELAPTLVASRLDETTEALDITMRDLEVKDDTIRQDLERKEEMQRSAMRTLVPLHRLSSPTLNPQFHQFATRLLANPKWKDVKEFS